MRSFSLAVRVVAIAVVFTVSAIGQQPTVLIYPSTSIDLPIEPVRLQTPMTLGDAAKHNNFPLFDAMYNAAPAHDASAFAELHSFWKWSMTDPLGAFYGDDVHATLAARYPDYAEYIADFGIIDSHGRAFYPSAETRTFLLNKAISGQRAVVAEAIHPSSVERRPPSAVVVRRARARVATPKHVAVAKPAVVVKPVVVAPIVAKPVAVVKPVVIKPVAVMKPAAVVATPLATPKKADARFGRGLLLMIAGLIALGMLSMVFSASGEEEPVQQQAETAEPMRIFPKKTA
jgi:hypothetical protein